MGFLSEVIAGMRAELAERPLDPTRLREAASAQPAARPWAAALRGAAAPALIAEVKRASPSAGRLADIPDPAQLALVYEEAGAAAVSVLTERRHFSGSLEDLAQVRRAVAVPVLRKDFLVDPGQVLEARAAGADAVLVIASAVNDEDLLALLSAARDLGMGVLLETHSGEDLERALATDAEVVGVTARDLETLEIDVAAALARLGRIPPERIAVMESAIASRSDVVAAIDAGASAILVGEALVRAGDPYAKARDLLGREAGR